MKAPTSHRSSHARVERWTANEMRAINFTPKERREVEAPLTMGIVAILVSLSLCTFFIIQGWIPYSLLPFPLLTSLYIYVVSRHVVPPPTSELEPGLYRGSRGMKYYILFAAFVGLLLPFLYILYTYLTGELHLVKAAAPSLFLLIIQVMSESYTYTDPAFSVLIRPLVAIVYNTRRLFNIWEEVVFLWGRGSGGVVWVGLAVAVANYLFWSWNLFGFLIPVFLVRSMRQYCDLERKVKQK